MSSKPLLVTIAAFILAGLAGWGLVTWLTAPASEGHAFVALSIDGSRALSRKSVFLKTQCVEEVGYWKTEGSDLLRRIDLRLEGPNPGGPVALSPNGDLILMTGRQEILTFDAASGERTSVLVAPEGATYAALAADSKRVLSVAGSRATYWNLSLAEPIVSFDVPRPSPDSQVTCMALSRDGAQAVFGIRAAGSRTFEQSILTLWDLPTHSAKSQIRPGKPPAGVVFAPDGKKLVMWDAEGGLTVFELPSGNPLRTFRASGTVTCAAMSPIGLQVAAGYSDGVLKIWDTTAGLQADSFVLPSRSDRVKAVEGRDIVDREVESQDVAQSVAYTPDGSTIVIGTRWSILRRPAAGR
jgi:WD40 repeat protein